MRLTTFRLSFIVYNMFVFVVNGFAVSPQAKDMTITMVKRNNLIANQGANHNIKVESVYQIVRGRVVIGSARVLIVKQSMCGLRVFELVSELRPKVGDRLVNRNTLENEQQEIFDQMEDFNFRRERPIEDQTRGQPRHQGVNRKGFIIGGGIGAGYLRNEASGLIFGTLSRATFLTDFKIGYAPTNALELYYVNKVSWWGESGITVIVALSSIGFTAFTNSQTSTGFFLTGGAGVSSVDAPFESVDASYGFGLFGGFGYEFVKHVTFETDFLYSHITDFGVDLDSFAIRVMINVLAY